MYQKSKRLSKNLYIKRMLAVFVLLLSAGLFSACGKGQEPEDNAIDISEIGIPLSGEDGTAGQAEGSSGSSMAPEGSGTGTAGGALGDAGPAGQSGTASGTQSGMPSGTQSGMPSGTQSGTAAGTSQGTSADASAGIMTDTRPETSADERKPEEMKQRFGADCIAEQTFEVELSEYDGKVWFVPYAPSVGNPAFRMHIIQNGKVLKEIEGYVPESLREETFAGLDAVSFFDVNYDDITDIVIIETYGNTSFAAVYYGYNDDYGAGFLSQEDLSGNISSQVEPLTVPNIRGFLSGGKKNGEFSSYQEAYRAVSRLYDMEDSNGRTYDLIYVDGDDIPELAAGYNGYYVSLYTFDGGKVYTLMDDWGYGAMGNAGYEYVPGDNRLRNYNNDYAGAVLYTTFMTVVPQRRIDISAEITTLNFDDVNGNGLPDESEMESVGKYSVNYMDGKEISEEEYASYNQGEYVYIQGKMSLEELLEKLK